MRKVPAGNSTQRLPSYDIAARSHVAFFSGSAGCRDEERMRLAPRKQSKAAQALAKYGQNALKPQKSSCGKWRKPLISARKVAILRKAAVLQGTYREASLSNDEIEAGLVHFKPSWDTPGQKILPSKPERKLKMAAKRVRRVATIEAQLAKQDTYLKKHRKSLQDAKPVDFMDKLMGNQPMRFE